MAYDFTSPGADATAAIQNFLLQQAALQHQQLMDSLAQQREQREAQIQSLNVQSLQEQRAAAAQEAKQKLAAGILSVLGPGDQVSPDTAATVKAGGLGDVL